MAKKCGGMGKMKREMEGGKMMMEFEKPAKSKKKASKKKGKK